MRPVKFVTIDGVAAVILECKPNQIIPREFTEYNGYFSEDSCVANLNLEPSGWSWARDPYTENTRDKAKVRVRSQSLWVAIPRTVYYKLVEPEVNEYGECAP